MKNIGLVLFALIVFTSVQAQTVKSQGLPKWVKATNSNKMYNKNGTVFLPETELRFTWDSLDWFSIPDTVLKKYNSQSQVTDEVRTMSTSSKTRSLYTYENGLKVAALNLYYNTFASRWDTSGREISYYNANGHKVKTEYLSYFMGNFNFSFADSTVYEYSNNRVVLQEFYFWQDSAFQKSNRFKWTYNIQGAPVELEIEQWNKDSMIYIKESRFSDMVWYDWNGELDESRPLSFKKEEWNGLAYELSERSTITYDASGNITEEKTEAYVSSNWEILEWGKNVLTYDNNGALLQSIEQQYKDTDFVNKLKLVYSDFYTSIVNAQKQAINAAISPNPIRDFATVKLNAISGNYKLYVFDMFGKQVYTTEIKDGETALDLSDLKQGIYFYTITNGSNQHTKGKLIVN